MNRVVTELQSQADGQLVRPRLGFLGVGWIGQNRLKTLTQSGAAKVVAFVEPHDELAQAARELTPGATAVDNLEALLEQNLDGIVISTPSAQHAQQASAALAAGIAVFCQKPLGRNTRETRQVIKAARDADRLLGLDLSYRYVTGMQLIREQIQSGQIGKIYGIDLVFHNAYGPDKPWYYDPKQSGGGCVIDLGIHLVDLALWVLDYPEVSGVSSRLFAQGEPLNGRRDRVEDFALARIDFQHSASANLACSWRLPAGCDAVIEAAFYGTEGGLALRNLNGSFYQFRAERYRGTTREVMHELDDTWGGRAIQAWAKRLTQDKRFDPTVERLGDVARVLDAIYGR